MDGQPDRSYPGRLTPSLNDSEGYEPPPPIRTTVDLGVAVTGELSGELARLEGEGLPLAVETSEVAGEFRPVAPTMPARLPFDFESTVGRVDLSEMPVRPPPARPQPPGPSSHDRSVADRSVADRSTTGPLSPDVDPAAAPVAAPPAVKPPTEPSLRRRSLFAGSPGPVASRPDHDGRVPGPADPIEPEPPLEAAVQLDDRPEPRSLAGHQRGHWSTWLRVVMMILVVAVIAVLVVAAGSLLGLRLP